MRLVLVILTGFAFAGSAAADVDQRHDNVEDCLAQAQGVTMEVDFCLSDEAERQDVRLNAAYEKALGMAEEGQRELLAQSQKDFLAYRDSWCAAKSGFLGSGRNQYRAQCHIRTTRERIAGLEGFDVP